MTTSAPQQRLDEVRRLLHADPDRFRRQGAVVASWRTAGGRRRGPYWSLRYRDADGRQRSRYLGRSPAVADAVRAELDQLQRPLRSARDRAVVRAAVQAAFRAHLRVMDAQLREWGMHLHGWKIRGWRNSKLRAELYQQVYGVTLSQRQTKSPPPKEPKPPRLPGLPKPPRLPRLPGIGGPLSREIERLLLWELEPEERRLFRPLSDQVRLRKPTLRRPAPPRRAASKAGRRAGGSVGGSPAGQRPSTPAPTGSPAAHACTQPSPQPRAPNPQPEKPKNRGSVDQRREGRGARGAGRVHRGRPPPA